MCYVYLCDREIAKKLFALIMLDFAYVLIQHDLNIETTD